MAHEPEHDPAMEGVIARLDVLEARADLMDILTALIQTVFNARVVLVDGQVVVIQARFKDRVILMDRRVDRLENRVRKLYASTSRTGGR